MRTNRCPHCGWIWTPVRTVVLPGGDDRYLRCPHCKEVRNTAIYGFSDRLQRLSQSLKNDKGVGEALESIFKISSGQTRPYQGMMRLAVFGLYKGIIGYKCDTFWTTSPEICTLHDITKTDIQKELHSFKAGLVEIDNYARYIDKKIIVAPLLVIGAQLVTKDDKATYEWIETGLYKDEKGEYKEIGDVL